MRVANEALRVISRPDAEPDEEFSHSAEDQRAAVGDDSSGLVDLLSDIDGLKHEINERIRRLEAVKQAKAILMEDAARTDLLNKRLAGLGLAPVTPHAAFPAGESELHNPDLTRLREAPPVTNIRRRVDLESKHTFAEPVETSALSWPKTEEPASHIHIEVPAVSALTPQEVPSQDIQEQPHVVEVTEVVSVAAPQAPSQDLQVQPSIVEVAVVAPAPVEVVELVPLLQVAEVVPVPQVVEVVPAPQVVAVAPAVQVAAAVPAVQVTQPAPRVQAAEVAPTVHVVQLVPTPEQEALSQELREQSRIAAEETVALERAIERLEQAEQMWKEYEQSALEARRLLDESAVHMNSAASKEQQATLDLLAAQEALAASQQAAQEALAASQQSAQEALAVSEQNATKRIDEAERCWKLVDEAAQAVRDRVEKAATELVEARAIQDAASADLLAARQDLTTAYQFASVAAQRRIESREFFDKAAKWVVGATAISWAIMAWLAWVSFRQIVPIWVPAVVSVLIVGAAFLLRTKKKEEA